MGATEIERFAGRVCELRATAGLTQQELAVKASVSRDTLARLEAGRTTPSWETVLAICSALGVSCEAFRQAPADAPRKGPGRPPKTKPAEEPAPPPKRPRRRGGA
jgi:DNA-binding XRE family transcriptional regulator